MANKYIPFISKTKDKVEKKEKSTCSEKKESPKEVVIPEDQKEIRNYAFSNSNLEKITIHAGVEDIPSSAFAGCNSLKTIVIDPANPNFWVKDGFVVANTYSSLSVGKLSNVLVAFEKKSNDVVIPEGVEAIGHYLFSHSDITSLTIANSVTRIDRDAFNECHNLEKIFIGDGLKDINAFFKGCKNLKEIKVSPDNPYLIMEDGMLLSKDKTSLYFAFPKDELVLPSTVDYISGWAFVLCKNIKIILPEKYECDSFSVQGCENCTIVCSDASKEFDPYDIKNLSFEMYHTGKPKSAKRKYTFNNVKKVVLPDYLKNISKWAFCNCTELEEVVIPETVETVEKHAFTDCISLHNLTLPKLVMTIEAEALTGVPDVKLSNLCTVTDGYFDLDAPLSFENSKGKLYSRKSTSELALYGIDTDESRQRYDLLNHWFGKVKPALKQSGFSFFYWNYADNTFAVRINDKIDVVFNTSTLLDAENVSGFINTLANNINNSNLGFKIVDEIVTAKVQKAAKAQKKSGPFVMVVSDEEKNATAKADKVVMMNELFFKGQMDEYLEKNADVTITVCNVDMNVDLGINYHDCFKFMIKVTTSSVEDGSAVAAVDSMLKELDQYNVRCKLV